MALTAGLRVYLRLDATVFESGEIGGGEWWQLTVVMATMVPHRQHLGRMARKAQRFLPPAGKRCVGLSMRTQSRWLIIRNGRVCEARTQVSSGSSMTYPQTSRGQWKDDRIEWWHFGGNGVAFGKVESPET